MFDRIVDEGQFCEEDARSVFRQIVDAIEYLHSEGIAHRDLKVVLYLFILFIYLFLYLFIFVFIYFCIYLFIYLFLFIYYKYFVLFC